MAKIRDSKGRSDENSGYTRLIGNPELGHLLSKLQAAVIRTGNELESILAGATPYPLVPLQHVMGSNLLPRANLEVVFKPALLLSSGHKGTGDFLIVDHVHKTAQVIELKDGDTFDTKKASGELESLKLLATAVFRSLSYETTYHFCSFNQMSKAAIVKGAKGRFSLDEVMTGPELCELLGIDFEKILVFRKLEQEENIEYFLDQLLEIEEAREHLINRLTGQGEN